MLLATIRIYIKSLTITPYEYTDLLKIYSPEESASNIFNLGSTHINETIIAGINYTNDFLQNVSERPEILNTTFLLQSNYTNTASPGATRKSSEIPIWLIPCYSVILLFAVVGNLLVISTLVQNRRMRTITNVFLLNLAISDILLGVLCMPVTLVGTLLRHFIFGEYFCKLIQFSQAASVAVSSWTLVAISCERYYAICHPLRSRTWQTINHANKIIAFIWIGSIICMTPIAVFSQLIPTSRQGLRKCREMWPPNALGYERSYNIFLDMVLLVFPLMILCFTYVLITRTLYISMRNERAMIFGSSYNTNRNTTSNMMLTGGENLNRTVSFHTHTRINSRYVNAVGNVNSGGGHCGDSNNFYGDSESNSTENEISYSEIVKHGAKHKPKHQQKYQHHSKCSDVSTSGGTKRNINSSHNDRRHLYCMRSDSVKSLKHNNDTPDTKIFINSTSNINNIRLSTSPSPSMTVINMPQHQRFQLHQERRKSNSTPSLRITEASMLRRSNESKSLESKKRVVKMLFVLVLEFFVCWTPLYVINTVAMFIGPALYEYVDYTSISFFQLLAYTSSCCNPITYCFMNANFRRAFVDTFKGIRLGDRSFLHKHSKKEKNLSIAGNSIVLANSVMSTHTYLESPRL